VIGFCLLQNCSKRPHRFTYLHTQVENLELKGRYWALRFGIAKMSAALLVAWIVSSFVVHPGHEIGLVECFQIDTVTCTAVFTSTEGDSRPSPKQVIIQPYTQFPNLQFTGNSSGVVQDCDRADRMVSLAT
jgi:hypothetical protein